MKQYGGLQVRMFCLNDILLLFSASHSLLPVWKKSNAETFELLVFVIVFLFDNNILKVCFSFIYRPHRKCVRWLLKGFGRATIGF